MSETGLNITDWRSPSASITTVIRTPTAGMLKMLEKSGKTTARSLFEQKARPKYPGDDGCIFGRGGFYAHSEQVKS